MTTQPSTLSLIALAFLEPEKLTDNDRKKLLGEHDCNDPIALEKEYTRLFLGIQEKNISLYASAWLSTTNLLHQAPLLEIQTIYHQNGLEVPPGSVEADHLGILLLFVDLLIQNHERELAKVFTEKYILSWLPALSERIQESQSMFYATLTDKLLRILYA